MEQFKLPTERKEYQTLETLDIESLVIAKYDSDQRIQNGGLISDVDIMIQNYYDGRQEEVDAYFDSLEY